LRNPFSRQYLPPEQKKSDEEIQAMIAGFGNETATAIADGWQAESPERFDELLAAAPNVAERLTPEDTEKRKQAAVKATKDRQARQADEQQIRLAIDNPAIRAKANGWPQYQDASGEMQDAGPPLTLPDVNGMIAQAKIDGAPPHVIEQLNEFRDTVMSRGGATPEDRIDQGVYTRLSDRMMDFDIKAKRKGDTEYPVKKTASVSEIFELQTDVMRARRLGQITQKDADTMLDQIVPAYLQQIVIEKGFQKHGLLGSGKVGVEWKRQPVDVYDAAFDKMTKLLENKGLGDNKNLKAAMFTTFLSYARASMPPDADPEKYPENQREIVDAVTRSFVHYLTNGMEYEGSPSAVILPDGRSIDLGTATTGTASAVRIGASAVESRVYREPNGDVYLYNYLKGTDGTVRLGDAVLKDSPRLRLKEAVELKAEKERISRRKGDKLPFSE
jgi:hypothetical protein